MIDRSCCQEEDLTSYWRTSSLNCPEDPAQPQMLSTTQVIDAKKQVKRSTTALNRGTRDSQPQRFPVMLRRITARSKPLQHGGNLPSSIAQHVLNLPFNCFSGWHE